MKRAGARGLSSALDVLEALTSLAASIRTYLLPSKLIREPPVY